MLRLNTIPKGKVNSRGVKKFEIPDDLWTYTAYCRKRKGEELYDVVVESTADFSKLHPLYKKQKAIKETIPLVVKSVAPNLIQHTANSSLNQIMQADFDRISKTVDGEFFIAPSILYFYPVYEGE